LSSFIVVIETQKLKSKSKSKSKTQKQKQNEKMINLIYKCRTKQNKTNTNKQTNKQTSKTKTKTKCEIKRNVIKSKVGGVICALSGIVLHPPSIVELQGSAFRTMEHHRELHCMVGVVGTDAGAGVGVDDVDVGIEGVGVIADTDGIVLLEENQIDSHRSCLGRHPYHIVDGVFHLHLFRSYLFLLVAFNQT